MVGLRFLVPSIGVRIPVRQHLAQNPRKGDFAFELPGQEIVPGDYYEGFEKLLR